MMAALDKVDASSAADATNTNTKSIIKSKSQSFGTHRFAKYW